MIFFPLFEITQVRPHWIQMRNWPLTFDCLLEQDSNSAAASSEDMSLNSAAQSRSTLKFYCLQQTFKLCQLERKRHAIRHSWRAAQRRRMYFFSWISLIKPIFSCAEFMKRERKSVNKRHEKTQHKRDWRKLESLYLDKIVYVFTSGGCIGGQLIRDYRRFRLWQRITDIWKPPSHHISKRRSFRHFIPFHSSRTVINIKFYKGMRRNPCGYPRKKILKGIPRKIELGYLVCSSLLERENENWRRNWTRSRAQGNIRKESVTKGIFGQQKN